MYPCVCGKKVLHYLHYLHLFSPASVPSRTYIGIDSRLRSYRPTPIYVWGDVDIRVKRCPYTYATLIRSRLAMAIPPPLSYASLGNQTGKNRGRSTVCNPYRLFARCARGHTSVKPNALSFAWIAYTVSLVTLALSLVLKRRSPKAPPA